MTCANNRKKINEIGLLYTIGVLLTILGHSHSNDWTTFPPQPVEFIYSFHMPLFFCISGYLFTKSSSLERDGYFKWIGDKSKRLLIPYFVISAISFIPKTLLDNGNLNDIGLNELFECFFAPRFNVWGHFWFLPVIFIFYFVFGLWRSFFYDNLKYKKCVVVGTLLAAIVLHFIKTDIAWLGFSDLCEFTVYFVIGISAHEVLKIKKLRNGELIVGSLLLTAVSIVLFSKFRHNTFVMFVESILMLVACLFLSQLLAEKKFKYVNFINENVFTFYICSWPFQAISEKILDFFALEWYVYTIVMFLIGIAAPCITIIVYRKLKFINCNFLSYLFGFRVVK